MSFPCYLAMTAAEFSSAQTFPPHIAWMACHFSSYGTGLSNFPKALPPGSILIINDRTPVQGHSPQDITAQLKDFISAFTPDGVLLDFQRPGIDETAKIAAALTESLPCPVGVTAHYAAELHCPVFLPPPPLYLPPEKYFSQWENRDIWLEAALENQCITLTETGSQLTDLPFCSLEEPNFTEEKSFCRYNIHIEKDSVHFTMSRDAASLEALLKRAMELGITKVIGLYQQLQALWIG